MKIDELKKINPDPEIDEQDKDENTALHLACANNHKKAVRVLVEAGATVDAIGEYGFTPLHSYARYPKSKLSRRGINLRLKSHSSAVENRAREMQIHQTAIYKR